MAKPVDIETLIKRKYTVKQLNAAARELWMWKSADKGFPVSPSSRLIASPKMYKSGRTAVIKILSGLHEAASRTRRE